MIAEHELTHRGVPEQPRGEGCTERSCCEANRRLSQRRTGRLRSAHDASDDGDSALWPAPETEVVRIVADG